jgi:hypothetical protein
MEKDNLEEFLLFIREHRSNEANFDKIKDRLNEEVTSTRDNAQLKSDLKEIIDKQLPEYLQSKEEGGSAWPQFEKLITAIEKAITEGMNSKNH